jgi:hypothetical protein
MPVPAPCIASVLNVSPGLEENRLVAGRGLKAPHDDIDVERIELDAAADATGLVGRDEPWDI